MTAYFVFDEAERLVCERIYFDALTMGQIGGVGVHLHVLLGQPRHGATGVEPTREGDGQARPLRRKRAEDAAHAASYHSARARLD